MVTGFWPGGKEQMDDKTKEPIEKLKQEKPPNLDTDSKDAQAEKPGSTVLGLAVLIRFLALAFFLAAICTVPNILFGLNMTFTIGDAQPWDEGTPLGHSWEDAAGWLSTGLVLYGISWAITKWDTWQQHKRQDFLEQIDQSRNVDVIEWELWNANEQEEKSDLPLS